MTKIIVIIFIGLSLPASAQNRNEWKSGFGQGTMEYFVENGSGNRIYIACPSSDPATVTATIMGRDANTKKGESMVFIIDSVEYRNEYENQNCRVCAANFVHFWEKLRNAKTLSVKFSNSVASEFSVNKLKSTLPPFKNSQCLTAF